MKHIFSVVFSIFLLFTISACGSSGGGSSTTTEGTTTAEIPVEELPGAYSGPGTLIEDPPCVNNPQQKITIVPEITYENGVLFWNSNAKIVLSYDPATGAAKGSGVFTDSKGNKVTESVDGRFYKDKDGNTVFEGTLTFSFGDCSFSYTVKVVLK